MQNWWYMFYVIGNYWREFIHKTSTNLNHIHRYSNDLLSVIITLGTYANGGETFFLMKCPLMSVVKDHVSLIIHTEGVWWVTLINFTKRLYLNWTQSFFIFYPLKINSLCTWWCKLLWHIYKFWWQKILLIIMGVVFSKTEG